MPNNQLLRNAFPKWFEGKGIFASMTSTPWQDEIDGITLDIEYFGNRSGYKFCAPLVYNFLDEDGAVTENGRQAIARVLLARYSKPWTRLWNLMKSQYDPLDNFSITEEIDMTSHASGQDKSNGTDTDKGTIETDHSGTDTNKSTGTEKTSRTGQNTSKDTSTATGSGSASRSGYNSTFPVTVNGQTAANSSTVNHVEIPNEDNTRTPDLTDERTLALKDKDTRDITIERNNLVERDNTQTDKGTRKRTGVSGLISRQRLVEQEREAWQWDFFESVFSDVDKILALSVYDPCVMSQFDYTGGGTSGGYVLPIATQAALGGVRAPAKTDGSVQVQVDAAGFLYVPPYPKIPEPSGGGKIEFASTDKLGGIKLPSEPSGDGEEVSTRNGVQFVVDKTLSPEGGYKNDDTVSVVIPYASEDDSESVTPGLIVDSPDPTPVNDKYGDYGGKLYPVTFPYGYLVGKHTDPAGTKRGVGYVVIPDSRGTQKTFNLGEFVNTLSKGNILTRFMHKQGTSSVENALDIVPGSIVNFKMYAATDVFSYQYTGIVLCAGRGTAVLGGNNTYSITVLVVDYYNAALNDTYALLVTFYGEIGSAYPKSVNTVRVVGGNQFYISSKDSTEINITNIARSVYIPKSGVDHETMALQYDNEFYLFVSGTAPKLRSINGTEYPFDLSKSTASIYTFTIPTA